VTFEDLAIFVISRATVSLDRGLALILSLIIFSRFVYDINQDGGVSFVDCKLLHNVYIFLFIDYSSALGSE
jgi:hypothetical protein